MKRIESITQKVDNFIFNVRNLNIIISLLLVVFVITFSVAYSREEARVRTENESYANMLKDIEEYQLNVIYSKVSPNNGYTDSSKEYENPIFSDAKEAVLTAFNKFNTYTSYEIESNGVSNALAVGQNVEIKISSLTVKYNSRFEYEKTCRVETKTNFGQSDANEIVYKNGQKYKRDGKNVRIENDKCVADFSGSYYKIDSSVNHLTNYIINENTIQHKRSFSFVRDKNNRILYYKATVTLDPETSITEYGKVVQEQGGTSFPVFSKIQLSCIIDRDGNLVSYENTEVMTVTKQVIFNITTTVTNTMTHKILSYNTTPSTPKPSL